MKQRLHRHQLRLPRLLPSDARALRDQLPGRVHGLGRGAGAGVQRGLPRGGGARQHARADRRRAVDPTVQARLLLRPPARRAPRLHDEPGSTRPANGDSGKPANEPRRRRHEHLCPRPDHRAGRRGHRVHRAPRPQPPACERNTRCCGSRSASAWRCSPSSPTCWSRSPTCSASATRRRRSCSWR